MDRQDLTEMVWNAYEKIFLWSSHASVVGDGVPTAM